MFGQVFAHKVIVVGLIAHTLSAPFVRKPLLSLCLRMLGEHHAKEALERVVSELPVKLTVRPTDQCVHVRRLGRDVVQPPIPALADVACAFDQYLLQTVVEDDLRMCRVSIVLLGHLGVRREDSYTLAHISLGMIGPPRAIGMERQQVDRHDGSMTQESAGYHPQLLRRSVVSYTCEP